jgi:MFS family permease
VNLLDVFKFPVTFWLICIICVFYYVTVFPFISMGLLFFRRKYDLDQSTFLFFNLASFSNSMVYILSAIISPIAGLAVDRFGRNVYWILGATFFTGVSHAIMAYTFTIPIVATFIMGISYSILASSLWPLVSFVVPNNALGSAYGMMQAIQNLGLALMSLVVGKLLDYKGYLITETFFILCLGVALIAGALLFLADAVKGGELNMSGCARRERAAAAALLAAEEKAASRENSDPEN